MTPEETSQKIQKDLEEITGKPLIIEVDNSISVSAIIKMADNITPCHFFKYREKNSNTLPYLLAFECMMALRQVQASPDVRFDLQAKVGLESDMMEMVRFQLKSNSNDLPESVITEMVSHFSSGLGLQLRSMPIAIR